MYTTIAVASRARILAIETRTGAKRYERSRTHGHCRHDLPREPGRKPAKPRQPAVLDHAERSIWYYFPNDQAGLPLGAMDHWQQKLAHRLLLSGLSLQAYSRACITMTLDNTLDVLENFADSDFRDTSRYYVSVFGDPAGEAPWGWRFQGHHVCVNYSLVDGEVAASTPLSSARTQLASSTKGATIPGHTGTPKTSRASCFTDFPRNCANERLSATDRHPISCSRTCPS